MTCSILMYFMFRRKSLSADSTQGTRMSVDPYSPTNSLHLRVTSIYFGRRLSVSWYFLICVRTKVKVSERSWTRVCCDRSGQVRVYVLVSGPPYVRSVPFVVKRDSIEGQSCLISRFGRGTKPLYIANKRWNYFRMTL